MGNKVDKHPYITINGNMVMCEEFDTMSLPTNTNDSINMNTLPATSTVTVTTKPLDKLKKEIDLIKSKESTNDIEKILKDYDATTILDYYESDSAINILKHNDEKALQLAHNIPKNDRGVMFKYFPDVPFELIMVMSKNINFNAVDKNGKTFLYGSNVSKKLKYICDLIENVDDININMIVNHRTFFETLILDKTLSCRNTELIKFFEVLDKKKYNFNKWGYNNDTFLTQILKKMPELTFILANTMKLDSFDITTESRWLYHILKHNLDHIHNYVYYMFLRKDYLKIVLGLYSNLYIDVWGDKFIIFLKKASCVHKEKTIQCLNYKNEKGNTIIHKMAKYHDDQTLQFCVNYFLELKFDPNNEEKTPLMLYNENKLENKLENNNKSDENDIAKT